MSDRLAVSASLSVLMMSIYVLFGGDAQRVPIGPDAIEIRSAAAASGWLASPAPGVHFTPFGK